MRPIYIAGQAASTALSTPARANGQPRHRFLRTAFEELETTCRNTRLKLDHEAEIPTLGLAFWQDRGDLWFEAELEPTAVAQELASCIRSRLFRGCSLHANYSTGDTTAQADGTLLIQRLLTISDVSILKEPGNDLCRRLEAFDRPIAPAGAFRQQRQQAGQPVSRKPQAAGRKAAASALLALGARPLPRGVVAAQQLRQAAAAGESAVVFGRTISAEVVQQLLRGGPTAIMG